MSELVLWLLPCIFQMLKRWLDWCMHISSKLISVFFTPFFSFFWKPGLGYNSVIFRVQVFEPFSTLLGREKSFTDLSSFANPLFQWLSLYVRVDLQEWSDAWWWWQCRLLKAFLMQQLHSLMCQMEPNSVSWSPRWNNFDSDGVTNFCCNTLYLTMDITDNSGA